MMNTRHLAMSLVGMLFVLSVARAQYNYGTSYFNPGLPEFPPVHGWLVSNQEFATILMNDTLGVVYICRGQRPDSSKAYVLVVRQPDSLFTMTWIDLNCQPDSSYRLTLDIRPFGDTNTPFPLDIRVVEKKLTFRWVLSTQTTPPGGMPVPADVAIEKGKAFPSLELVKPDGGTIASSSFHGNVTVINSWATWCTGCVDEIPGFNKLVDKYGKRVRFMAVAQNNSEELQHFLQRKPFTFTHAIANNDFIQLFGAAVPRTVILDRVGTIVYDQSGGSTDTYKQVDLTLEQLSSTK